MQITPRPNLVLASFLVAALALGGIATTQAKSASHVFTGHYDWRDGGRDDLRAEFRPDGDGQWLVTFRFRFDERAKTWRGTAEGDLEDGSQLEGSATWRSRKWTWAATIEDGVMRGTHTELKSRGKTYETGTFELSR